MNIIRNFFVLKKNSDAIKFEAIKVKHGDIYSNGYLFNQIGYISDCSSISNKSLNKLKNLKLLIIDCLNTGTKIPTLVKTSWFEIFVR